MAESTLRHRLHALVFLWVAVFSVVAGLATQSSLPRLREAALEERTLLGLSVARSLDSQLEHLFADLRELSSQIRPPFREHVESLRALRLTSPFRHSIYVLDGDGALLAADPRATAPIAPEWLRQRESVTPSLRKAPAADPVVAIIQPFAVAGRTHYLVAEMGLQGSPLGAFLESLASHRELHLLVVDRGGLVLAAADARAVARQLPAAEAERSGPAAARPGTAIDAPCYACEGESADRFVTIRVPLELAPWEVIVQERSSRVFGAVRWARSGLVGALAMVAITGAALAWSLSRSVVAPILRLSRQAEGLREGDLSTPIEVAADRELTVLADTLDEARRRLAASLEDLETMNATLEQQVDERTREVRRLLDRALADDARRRSLVRRLLSAGEEERRRIARELHDEIAQLLTAVVLALERIPHEDRRIVQARELLARTQDEIRRIISDLRPSLLDDLGLAMAVRSHARDFLDGRGLSVGLEIDEELHVPAEIETAAFRIYQEIATNITRHSGAENVAIELYVDDGALTLSVEDDGVGFEPAAEAGTGILGMHERASLVGGTIRIESAPGTGTHVRFECPLGAPEPAAGAAAADDPPTAADP